MVMPLEDVLLGAYEAPEEIPDDQQAQEVLRERFRIKDDAQADWALRKIAKARRRFAEAEELAMLEVRKIQAWLDDIEKSAEREESFFAGLLREYHMGLLAEDPKHKTHKLPNGQLQMRETQPEFVRDDQILLRWLKERNLTQYVETIERPQWGELKKALQVEGTKTVYEGEQVPGIMVNPKPPTFRVVIKEDVSDDNISKSH
ncbi:MAG: hypothetical protein HPY52_11185 [Firmicutes bacterium]|nr:hypothetical protein [Bacillota bacterium]